LEKKMKKASDKIEDYDKMLEDALAQPGVREVMNVYLPAQEKVKNFNDFSPNEIYKDTHDSTVHSTSNPISN